MARVGSFVDYYIRGQTMLLQHKKDLIHYIPLFVSEKRAASEEVHSPTSLILDISDYSSGDFDRVLSFHVETVIIGIS